MKPNHRDARRYAKDVVARRRANSKNLALAYLHLQSRAKSIERIRDRLRRLLIKIDQLIFISEGV